MLNNYPLLVLNNSDSFGFIAATLTTIAFLPQLIKTWTEKSAENVSKSMLILFILGVFLWIIYGWETHSTPVIVANIITFILNCFILGLKIYYERNITANED
tara:strand:+ start:94 stop:399 length:306 start_codon:yes stop_codon:yes gene_type:complete